MTKLCFILGAGPSKKLLGNYRPQMFSISPNMHYPNVKDFIITVLHEIKHALDAKKMGKKRYQREYEIAGELALQKGGDFHDDNKFEEDAEKWGKKEYRKWKNKI